VRSHGVGSLAVAVATVLLLDGVAIAARTDRPAGFHVAEPTTSSSGAPAAAEEAATTTTVIDPVTGEVVPTPTSTSTSARSTTTTTARRLTGLTADAAGFAGSYQLLWESDQALERDLQAMASTKARWFRIDVNWPSIQPSPDRWDWGPTDRVIGRARQLGFQVLGTLAYTPEWNRPPGTSDKWAPIDHDAYATFVAEAVKRYQPLGVRHWEIWNEPNQAQWWRPRPDPASYADLLQRGSRAAKAVDPNAVIVTAGLAPAPDAEDGNQVNAATFVRRLYDAGAGGSFDAVGMHPYSFPVRPTFDHPMNAFAGTMPALHQLMVEHGDGAKKIWLTEYGAPTHGAGAVSEDDQGAFLDEAFRTIAGWDWAGPLFVYHYRDTGTDRGDREQNFGLVRADGEPKPAWRRLAEILRRPFR
jgi:hypothetical protein